MTGLVRGILGRAGGLPARLRFPEPGSAELRRDLERTLHNGPALRVSALALELSLISGTVTDPRARELVDAAQERVCRIVDDLRDVGQALYPPVLVSAGVVPALREAADRCGLALRLDVPPSGLAGPSASRVCLLLVDHLRSLRPGTAVAVRIRGWRRLVGVHVREDRPGHASRHRWAVVRCG